MVSKQERFVPFSSFSPRCQEQRPYWLQVQPQLQDKKKNDYFNYTAKTT